MSKIVGKALPDMPWQDKDENDKLPVWRYKANPIIDRFATRNSNSIFNSAVVPFEDGYAGIFRCDSRSISMDIFAGFSKDGIHWDISDDPIVFHCDDEEIGKRDYRYDPRVCFIEDRYYITWCNGYHGYPTIGVGYTFDFKTFYQLENAFLPFNRNGYKFFDRDGGLEHDDITEVLKIASELSVADADISGVETVDSISVYCDFLKDKIKKSIQAQEYDTPLKELHVVVDTGNGAGGFFVDKVLKPLGADTSGSQFLEPDGNFPNHIPNPENKQAMDAIRSAVLNNQADLGIIFDTDVDRMSAVLPNGEEVNRDAIIAMMTAIIAADYPGGTIVTDSVTSDRLTRFIESIGMKQHRYMRGYKNVINESIRLNKEGIVSPCLLYTSDAADE